MCSRMLCRFWLPSSRLIVIVNGVNAPACRFRLPAVSDGANGSGSAHGAPFGPEADLRTAARTLRAGGLPDHGAIDAVVVYEPQAAACASGARDATEEVQTSGLRRAAAACP